MYGLKRKFMILVIEMLSLRIKISASAWVSKKPFQSPISSVAAAVEAFNMTSAGHKSSSKVLISTTDSLQTQPYLYSLERTFFMNRKKFCLTFHCTNSLFGRLIATMCTIRIRQIGQTSASIVLSSNHFVDVISLTSHEIID